MTAAALREATRRREAKAKAYERALGAWLTKVGRYYATFETRAGGLAKAAKTRDEKAFAIELAELVRRFGLRVAVDATNRTAGSRITDGSMVRDAIAAKEVALKWYWEWDGTTERRVEDILDTTQQAVRDAIKTIHVEANQEIPTPSAGEIARRIRTSFAATEPKDRIFAFSPERAAVIARTEITQAENTGIMQGYETTGVRRIRWLAYSDGRSGDRHHERMHGVETEIGTPFRTPLGNRLRYPGDPMGAIEDTAQCRCATRAVLV